MSTIIPMHPSAAYRQALEETSNTYTFSGYPKETQDLLEAVFREGWVRSKMHTIETLDQLTKEAENGDK